MNESSGPSDLIFADAIGSVNDNDDMQINTTKDCLLQVKKQKVLKELLVKELKEETLMN